MASSLSPRLAAALVVVATAAVHSGTLANDFVRYDDDRFVLQSPVVTAPDTLTAVAAAFHEPILGNWAPLAFLSTRVDALLYGMAPAGHHASSVLLHALAAGLLFLAIARGASLVTLSSTTALAAALFTALAFGLHPLRVESVAWLAERRDVLCGVFVFAAAAVWLSFQPRGAVARIAVFVLGTCAMLSKSSAVTLPAVLLVLDVWPLRRKEPWARLVLEKLPLACVAVLTSWVTMVAQGPSSGVPLVFRLQTALVAYAHAIVSFVAPHDLAALYPRPSSWPAATVAWSALLVAALAVLAVAARKRAPAVTVGVALFFGVMLPMSGVVQVGDQAFADRYSYLPDVGLAVAAAGALGLLARAAPRTVVASRVVVALWLVALTALTLRQIPVWRDTRALFQNALDKGADSALANEAVGNDHAARGELREALPYLAHAVELDASAHNLAGLGFARLHLGDVDGARAAYAAAVAADPVDAAARNGLGLALAAGGDVDRAALHLRLATVLAPGVARFHVDRARYGGDADVIRAALDAALACADLRPSDAVAAAVLRARALDDVAGAAVVFRAAAARWPNAVEAVAGVAWAACQDGPTRDPAVVAGAVAQLRALTGATPLVAALSDCRATLDDVVGP